MALITVINNVQSFEFPKLSVDSFNMTHNYYFFGCITVDTSKYTRGFSRFDFGTKISPQVESSPPTKLRLASFSTETTTVSGSSSEIIIAKTSIADK